MTKVERFRLRFGPYKPPPFRIGRVVHCQMRGRVRIVGETEERITDSTVYSRDLLQTLQRGRPAGGVAAWVESKNNVTAASRHFIARMITEADTYGPMPPNHRYTRAENWLDDAAVNQAYLVNRLTGQLSTAPIYAPADQWLGQLRMFEE